MAKCKACGGSGKVKEDDKKGQDLPRAPKSPDRERDWKRKPTDYNNPPIGSVRRGKNPEDRKNPRDSRKKDEQNIGSKSKKYTTKEYMNNKPKPLKRVKRLGT